MPYSSPSKASTLDIRGYEIIHESISSSSCSFIFFNIMLYRPVNKKFFVFHKFYFFIIIIICIDKCS